MRQPATVVLAVVIAASAVSCASPKNPAPAVPVAGSDAGALAGRWQGDYSSASTGRSGSIVFELKAGDRVARGDVLMVLQDPGAPASRLPGANDSLSSMPQVLSINFVSSSGGVVTGTMDPYRDPGCDCEVRTTFVGRVSGDTIEGTFTTTPTGAAQVTTGRWKMTRQKK